MCVFNLYKLKEKRTVDCVCLTVYWNTCETRQRTSIAGMQLCLSTSYGLISHEINGEGMYTRNGRRINCTYQDTSRTLSGFNCVRVLRRLYRETGKRNAAFRSNNDNCKFELDGENYTSSGPWKRTRQLPCPSITANKTYFHERGLLLLH